MINNIAEKKSLMTIYQHILFLFFTLLFVHFSSLYFKMAYDDFCLANFNCTSSVVEGIQCFDYYKFEHDVNCHIPCLVDNCTAIPNEEPRCVEFSCIAHLIPAHYHYKWTALISGLSTVAILTILTVLFLAHRYIHRYRRRQSLSHDEEDENAPIIRNSELREVLAEVYPEPRAESGAQDIPEESRSDAEVDQLQAAFIRFSNVATSGEIDVDLAHRVLVMGLTGRDPVAVSPEMQHGPLCICWECLSKVHNLTSATNQNCFSI